MSGSYGITLVISNGESGIISPRIRLFRYTIRERRSTVANANQEKSTRIVTSFSDAIGYKNRKSIRVPVNAGTLASCHDSCDITAPGTQYTAPHRTSDGEHWNCHGRNRSNASREDFYHLRSRVVGGENLV
ncbi:hypothetical protein CBL_09810 [Carabus blaptoides fortunei]